MALSKIPSAGFQDNVKFRNIIINGDMSIAQRGTSSTNVSSGYHTCDRWRIFRGAGTITMSQETDAPTGSGFVKSLKFLEAGSGANPSAGDRNFVQHKMEGQNLQYIKKGTSSAEQLTLSFHVKSTVTGTYIAELYDEDNTRQVSKAYTISSANTWEYKTITFPADTSGTLDNDNANSMNINLYFTVGTNFSSGTLNTTWNSVTDANRAVGQVNALASANGSIQWTGVQLEAGTTASDFEFLPVDVNLRRCQRYLPSIEVVTYHVGGICFSSTDARATLKFPVKARAKPTGISYDGTIKFTNNAGNTKGTGVAFLSASQDYVNIGDVGAADLSAGDSTSLATDASNVRTILCTGSEL